MQAEIRQGEKKGKNYKYSVTEFKSLLEKVKSRILNQKCGDNKFEKFFQNGEGKDKVMKSMRGLTRREERNKLQIICYP